MVSGAMPLSSEPVPLSQSLLMLDTLLVSASDVDVAPNWVMLLLAQCNCDPHGWVSSYICSSEDQSKGVFAGQMGRPTAQRQGPGFAPALLPHV